MKNIDIQLPKYAIYVIYVIGLISILTYFRGCSTSSENIRMKKEIVTLNAKVDSLAQNSFNKKEQEIIYQIEGFRISKRMLYDNNAIVRTTIRPDDRMNEYDEEIGKLEKKLRK
jgi:hypothetical protein